jgi:hypothetical protein
VAGRNFPRALDSPLWKADNKIIPAPLFLKKYKGRNQKKKARENGQGREKNYSRFFFSRKKSRGRAFYLDFTA